MSRAFDVDKQTAIRVAEMMERDGNLRQAADVWLQLIAMSPYERRPPAACCPF